MACPELAASARCPLRAARSVLDLVEHALLLVTLRHEQVELLRLLLHQAVERRLRRALGMA